jgi:hypothetical protein
MTEKDKEVVHAPIKRSTVSRERVRQIQEHALGKLRKLMYAKGYKFEDFFDDSKKKG